MGEYPVQEVQLKHSEHSGICSLIVGPHWVRGPEFAHRWSRLTGGRVVVLMVLMMSPLQGRPLQASGRRLVGALGAPQCAAAARAG